MMLRTKTWAARQPTTEKIIVYGHNKSAFQTQRSLIDNVTTGIVKHRFRYRYTHFKHANLIVLSLGGAAFGHFEISGETTPDDQDRAEYPPVRKVYIVSKRATYSTPAELLPLDIRVHRFDTYITAAQFGLIKMKADIEEYPCPGKPGS
jgi:hypothetical protein